MKNTIRYKGFHVESVPIREYGKDKISHDYLITDASVEFILVLGKRFDSYLRASLTSEELEEFEQFITKVKNRVQDELNG